MIVSSYGEGLSKKKGKEKIWWDKTVKIFWLWWLLHSCMHLLKLIKL